MPHRSRYKKYIPNFDYNNLPLPDNFEKKDITFKIFEDVEHTNKGFQVDMILAYWYGYPLGYHTIMYYPEENVNVHLPDAKTYKRKINGWYHEFQVTETTEKQYNAYLKYIVNKPRTDFIRVHKLYKRKGIGEMLALKGVKHCLKKFKCYYFSNNVNDESGPLFEKIKKNFQVHTEKGDGIYFDKNQIRHFIKV